MMMRERKNRALGISGKLTQDDRENGNPGSPAVTQPSLLCPVPLCRQAPHWLHLELPISSVVTQPFQRFLHLISRKSYPEWLAQTQIEEVLLLQAFCVPTSVLVLFLLTGLSCGED